MEVTYFSLEFPIPGGKKPNTLFFKEYHLLVITVISLLSLLKCFVYFITKVR